MCHVARERVREDIIRHHDATGSNMQQVEETNIVLFLAINENEVKLAQGGKHRPGVTLDQLHVACQIKPGKRLSRLGLPGGLLFQGK